MGSRLAARMAGIIPLTRPVMHQDDGGDDESGGGDEQADVGGFGVLGDGAVEGDAPYRDGNEIGKGDAGHSAYSR